MKPNQCAFIFRLGLVLTLAVMPCRSIQSRTFTSNDGKAIEAEISSADASGATLDMADGRKTLVPLSRLSLADQEFVKAWVLSHPAMIHYSFSLDWSKERTNSKHQTMGTEDVTENQYVCHFKVTNRSASPLTDVEVVMQTYYKRPVAKAASTTQHETCTRTIPSIKAGETVTVDSDPVNIFVSVLKGGYYYKDGAASRQSDTITGVAATIKHAGKQVFEYVSNGIKKEADSSDSPGKAAKKPKSTQ